MNRPCVLVVAGSDSSGGAGIARDVETIVKLGGYACVSTTAITVQTHTSVTGIVYSEPALIAAQMAAALEANPVGAIKIGMLGRAAAVEAVAGVLSRHPNIPAIFDPVISASSGKRLVDSDAVSAMRNRLLACCHLLTPNLPELEELSKDADDTSSGTCSGQARKLMDLGCRAVLVKGGHAGGTMITDTLFRRDLPPQHFTGARLPGSMRGTGCILSSAIALRLAAGDDTESAVRRARAHLTSVWKPA